MKGSCLCGAIEFELLIDKMKIYQCHCDLCRKQSGTASSCGSVIAEESFRWLSELPAISKWEKESGFTSHFCSNCGSSVPNKFREEPFFWVPAGTVDSENMETVANIFVCEKTKWSNVSSVVNPFKARPQVKTLVKLLCGEDA